MYEYTTQYYTHAIAVEEYVARFRDAERILALCRQCPNYGKSWGCPPFDYDTDAILRKYQYVHLVAVKITPAEENIPIEKSQNLLIPERLKIEKELLELERRYDGRAFTFVGKCLYCGDASCARTCNRPCRHPDKVRPSLEAFGFDITRTLSELFGIELLWGKEGVLPPYLTLVCALFHNSAEPLTTAAYTPENSDRIEK